MLRRILLLSAALAAVLVLAAPALADSNGARTNYENETLCAGCHDTGGISPTIVPEWKTSAHSMEALNAVQLSEGPACAGCHSGNYDPTKARGALVSQPSATPTVYPTGTPLPDSSAAYSEPFIGCSACHYNSTTMHTAGFNVGSLADPDICGQCHARFGKTVASYTYTPLPMVTATIQPMYPVGYDPFPSPSPTSPAQPLTDVLNVPLPGSPIGNLFWPDPITASARSHGESAVQYEELLQNRFTGTGSPAVTHMNALDTLKSIGQGDNTDCLPCHSADYQIEKAAGMTPDTSTLEYGDVCVTCHDPHAAGPQQSVFNSSRNPQLVASQSTLCTRCHNTGIGTPNVAATDASLPQLRPGQEVNHPQLEMMSGGAAIGVPVTPSVHKGDCVQCHMVPTGIEFDGVPGTGANHLFKVITPEYAATHTMTVSGRTGPMPNSACGQCHGTPTDTLALYLQPVLDSRQSLFDQQSASLSAKLDKAAIGIGYVDVENATADLAEKPDVAAKNASARAFLTAETNWELVTQDRSRGIHNWAYTEKIFAAADAQVAKARPTAFTVTFKASKRTASAGRHITLSGTVSSPSQSAGKKVLIQLKKRGSVWRTVARFTLQTGKTNATYKHSWRVRNGRTVLRAKFGPLTISGVRRPAGRSNAITVTGR